MITSQAATAMASTLPGWGVWYPLGLPEIRVCTHGIVRRFGLKESTILDVLYFSLTQSYLWNINTLTRSCGWPIGLTKETNTAMFLIDNVIWYQQDVTVNMMLVIVLSPILFLLHWYTAVSMCRFAKKSLNESMNYRCISSSVNQSSNWMVLYACLFRDAANVYLVLQKSGGLPHGPLLPHGPFLLHGGWLEEHQSAGRRAVQGPEGHHRARPDRWLLPARSPPLWDLIEWLNACLSRRSVGLNN